MEIRIDKVRVIDATDPLLTEREQVVITIGDGNLGARIILTPEGADELAGRLKESGSPIVVPGLGDALGKQ